MFLGVIGTLSVVAMYGGGKGEDPKAVTIKFVQAVKKLDFEKAKEYGTPETDEILDLLSAMQLMLPDSVKVESKKYVEVTVLKESIDGDKAEVIYKTSDDPNNETNAKLVYQEKQWLVAMSKDDMSEVE